MRQHEVLRWGSPKMGVRDLPPAEPDDAPGHDERSQAPAHPLHIPTHPTSGGKMERWDTVVIGSGSAGLTAALALARAGQKVLVLEQHYLPGGWMQSFSLNGYR